MVVYLGLMWDKKQVCGNLRVAATVMSCKAPLCGSCIEAQHKANKRPQSSTLSKRWRQPGLECSSWASTRSKGNCPWPSRDHLWVMYSSTATKQIRGCNVLPCQTSKGTRGWSVPHGHLPDRRAAAPGHQEAGCHHLSTPPQLLPQKLCHPHLLTHHPKDVGRFGLVCRKHVD